MATIPVLRAREKPQSWADIASGFVQGVAGTYLPRKQKELERQQQGAQLQELMDSGILKQKDPMNFIASIQNLDPSAQKMFLEAFKLKEKQNQFEEQKKFLPGFLSGNTEPTMNEFTNDYAPFENLNQFQELLENEPESPQETRSEQFKERYADQPQFAPAQEIAPRRSPMQQRVQKVQNDPSTWSPQERKQAAVLRNSRDPYMQMIGQRAYDVDQEIENREKIAEKQKIEREKFNLQRDSELYKRNKKFFDEIETTERELPLKKGELKAMIAMAPDVSRFSKAYFAEVLDQPWLANAASATYATASKNFLFSELKGLGGKLNLFIDKRANDALLKVGQTEEANLSSAAMYEFKHALEEDRVRIANQLRKEYLNDPSLEKKHGSISSYTNELLRDRAQHHQNVLAYRLEALREREKGEKAFDIKGKVTPGTPLTIAHRDYLKKKFNGDMEKIMEYVDQNGFTIPSEETVKDAFYEFPL